MTCNENFRPETPVENANFKTCATFAAGRLTTQNAPATKAAGAFPGINSA